MDYKKYFNRIEKSAKVSEQFPNQYHFTHRENNYYADALSYRGIRFNYVISSHKSRAYGRELEGLIVEVYIYKKGYVDSYFNQLQMYKKEIENELQLDNIVWQPREQTLKQSAARIFAYKAVNLEDELKWDEYIEWQVNTMVKFLEVFPKYIDKFINDEVIERENSMKVKFNDKVYKKNNRSGAALKDLCFDIFKQYLEKNPNLSYEKIQSIFNQWHCNNNAVVLSKNEWEQKTEDLKKRYFDPVSYNGMELYFTTQWGNNGGDCDNINNMISFAKSEGYDIEILDSQTNDEVEDLNSQPKTHFNSTKNIILYGVPGVGKTYNTNKLIKLIEDGNSDKNIFEAIKRNELNNGTDISGLRDRVSFVTFHQSFGYEDFIEGFRPNEEGKIELVDGIFKRLCKAAQANLENSTKSDKERKEQSELFQKFQEYVNYKLEHDEPIQLQKSGEFKLIQLENNKLHFSTSENSIYNTEFTLSFDDFYKIYKSSEKKNSLQDISIILGTNSIQQKYAYYLAIYNDFEKYGQFKRSSGEKELTLESNRKIFYLVIDEINRGNISKIFGELITLIEEDKRDTLEVTLPYSKEKFSVPSNLFIIGTMNSTDKSIALIDVALRRRFTFLKMEPNDELIADVQARKLFNDLNAVLKDKLGEDHQIGHSYFMNIQNDDDLDFVLEYKIKPLLEEYFYGDNDGLNEMLRICGFGEDGEGR